MGELQLAIRHNGLKAARRLPLVLWSVWIVFLVELLSRGRWMEAFGWTFRALPELALNALVVLGFILLLTAVTNSVRFSFWIVSTVCLIFGLISGIKLEILGVPFLPWDMLLTSESKDMAQYVRGLGSFTVISGFIAFIAVSLLLLYKLPPVALRLRWKQRVLVGIGSVLLLVSIYSDGTVSLKKFVNVQNLAWDQTENVKTNGFLLSTVMNLKFLFLKAPGGYDSQSVRAFTSSVPPAVPVAGEIRPNIIVVLSESFWDATQIKGISFSKDPLPFYHSLSRNYSSGTMLSPQFGGGTANVEFEMLTGHSMGFLPQGSVPYNQYIDKEVDSLASILTRQGYASTAINPFHSWFYNSKKVYENFGFSRYISQEFFEPDYEGPYLADRSVAKYITETSGQTPGPDFIFANTMENHYHYYPGKFKENTIEVTGVTGESKGLLETYAQGLLGADDMLRRLVTHYEQVDEPTIIVFFGDHLPSLGSNYKAYKESGYLQENDPDFENKMHRVPVLVWNNYMPKEPKAELNMSTSLLGPYVLKLAQRPGSYYTDFLYQLSQETPIIPPKSRYKEAGVSEEKMRAYEKLQYDSLFGQQYAYGDWKHTIKHPDYTIGLGKMVIQSVRGETSGADRLLTVTGSSLPHNAIVQINGQPAVTKRNGSGDLTAVVTPEMLKSSPLKIEVLVKDSKNKIVARSEPYVQPDTAFAATQNN